MQTFEVVDADVSHAPAAGEIIRRARHEAYAPLGTEFIDGMHNDDGGYDNHFRNVFEQAHRVRAVVLGNVLAAIAITDVLEDRMLHISYLYTHSGWRGRGIGSRLLDDTLDYARSADFVRVTLNVFSGNIPAIRLYEGQGFRTIGQLEEPYYVSLGLGNRMSVELASP